MSFAWRHLDIFLVEDLHMFARMRPLLHSCRPSVFALLLLLTAVCNKSPRGQPSGPPVSPEARKEAEEIFSTRCTTCHGPSGRGDGPASAGLSPKPRNYHDKTWQASITD